MKNPQIQQTLRFMRWVTLTLILVLGGLMTHDAVRAGARLAPARLQLDELKLKDLDDPELAQTVRDLDYLYRVTYFQTQDRRARGFLLLGVAFLLLCGMTCLERYLFAPALRIPEPSAASPEQQRRQILTFSIGGLVVLCAVLVVLRLPHRAELGVEGENNSALHTPHSALHTPQEQILLAGALKEETHHWPQFRGSVLPNQNALPASWDLTEKWRVEVPLEGFNSPVIWDDNIFLGGGDKTERAIFCYDANTGDQLWKTACNHATEIPKVDDYVGFSAPTLCCDAKRVYAVFATGEMLCCSHDGTEVWRKLLPSPDISYGYASSLLLLGDRLIVQYDLLDTHTMYAINAQTGETIWERRREAAQSWATPVALVTDIDADGKAVIFAATNKTAEVFDAETGEIIWSHRGMGGEVATGAFADVARNAFYFSNASAFTGAFSATDGTILCQNGNVPSPDVASPVLFGDKYLLFTSGGSVIAIDAENAKELYEEDFDNGFNASPVIVQNKIVAVNLDGDLFLMDAAGDKLIVEGTYPVGKEVVATPAFCRGTVIIRTYDNELICLE